MRHAHSTAHRKAGSKMSRRDPPHPQKDDDSIELVVESLLDRAFSERETVLWKKALLRATRADSADAGTELDLDLLLSQQKNALREFLEAGVEAREIIRCHPAILIEDGCYVEDDLPSPWAERLQPHKNEVNANIKSVGRIEAPGEKGFATGFVVAEGVVMTNRHVAEEFCRKGPDGAYTFKPEAADARIDFREERYSEEPAEFHLQEIVGIHPDPDVDMALFRIETVSTSGKCPPPLRFSPTPPVDAVGRHVYVVGYPTYDEYSPYEELKSLFMNIFDVKRLQPGTVTNKVQGRPILWHDCSTLMGNSGSCVLDLETNRLLGLHFGGVYHEHNEAVALWELDPKTDPLLSGIDLAS